MKALYFIFFTLSLFCTKIKGQAGHFRVRSDAFVQIGYDSYKTLSLGASTSSPNNGNWAIEHWNGGLNFWKPWPTFSTVNYALFIRDGNHFVGIGKYPNHALDVNGDIATYGTIRIYSDERLKANITKLSPQYCLNIVQNLNTYSYHLISEKLPPDYSSISSESIDDIKQKTIEQEQKDFEKSKKIQTDKLRHGFLAQELEEVVPSLVKTDKDGLKSIDQMALIPILLEAVKAQQKEINLLKIEIQNLKKNASNK